jgi:predicted TIM-barrel fold metal-dependent hydrolase
MSVDPRTLPLARYLPRPALRAAVTHRERPCVPAIDAHNHLGRWLTETWVVPDVPQLLDLLDACGVTSVVNLDGRWGTELEANLERYDRAHPGRFATFCHVDWLEARTPGWSERLVTSLRDSASRGARGLKVWKDLGLGFEDERGDLLLPDDERIAPLWHEAGELGLPVLIHTADPVAFFDPIDEHNERLEELGVHPEWSFHGGRFPTFQRLIESLEAIVAAHPQTTFIGAHVGCYAEDLAWVDRMLAAYPNFHVDISARIAELGRQPRATARLIRRHPDRVLFGSDCFPPERADYETAWRFLESEDEHFPYGDPDTAPTQGRWAISGLGLEREVLDAVYRTNAERILRSEGARPLPTVTEDREMS